MQLTQLPASGRARRQAHHHEKQKLSFDLVRTIAPDRSPPIRNWRRGRQAGDGGGQGLRCKEGEGFASRRAAPVPERSGCHSAPRWGAYVAWIAYDE